MMSAAYWLKVTPTASIPPAASKALADVNTSASARTPVSSPWLRK